MSMVPLRYRPAELAPGGTEPRRGPRWSRVAGWGSAALATFAGGVALGSVVLALVR